MEGGETRRETPRLLMGCGLNCGLNADFWLGLALGSTLILLHSSVAWMMSSMLSKRNNLHP